MYGLRNNAKQLQARIVQQGTWEQIVKVIPIQRGILNLV